MRFRPHVVALRMVGPKGVSPRPGTGRLERYFARPWRLAVVVLLLVGIPTVVVSVMQIQLTRADLRSQMHTQVKAIAAEAAVIVDERVVALRDAVAAVTADPDLRDAAAARNAVVLIGMLHRTRGAMGPDIGDVAVYDVAGRYFAGSPFRPELAGTPIEGGDVFVRAVMDGGPSISATRSGGLAFLSVSAPLRDPAGGPLGIAVASVELARVAAWVAPLLASVDEVYLLDGSGQLMLRASDPRQREMRDVSGDPVIREVLSGRTSAEERPDPLTRRPSLLGVRQLTTTGWYAVTSSSPERVDRQMRPLVTSFLATTALLVALLLGAAVLLGHTSARMLETMRQQALTDPLTGLYNRRSMKEQIVVFHSLAQRHGRPYCVIAFDLDGLKHVNDAFGHEAGDDAIRGFAQLLRRSLRDSDIAVRLGGDEFIALLPETSLAEATAAFDRVHAAMKEFARDPRHAVTVSAGVVSWQAGRSSEDLIRLADELLYRAKREGKDRMVSEAAAM